MIASSSKKTSEEKSDPPFVLHDPFPNRIRTSSHGSRLPQCACGSACGGRRPDPWLANLGKTQATHRGNAGANQGAASRLAEGSPQRACPPGGTDGRSAAPGGHFSYRTCRPPTGS